VISRWLQFESTCCPYFHVKIEAASSTKQFNSFLLAEANRFSLLQNMMVDQYGELEMSLVVPLNICSNI
jgi:hypothetical protein